MTANTMKGWGETRSKEPAGNYGPFKEHFHLTKSKKVYTVIYIKEKL